MAFYRISRTMPNGWNMRLDFISYDGSFSDTVTNLDEIVITEIGALTADFDSLPYGLMNPMSFGFSCPRFGEQITTDESQCKND